MIMVIGTLRYDIFRDIFKVAGMISINFLVHLSTSDLGVVPAQPFWK